MILYYAVTSYHVLCCILHKMKWNKDKEAVLYISNTHPECDKLKACVESGNVFEKVGDFPDKGRMLPYKKRYKNQTTPDYLKRLTKELRTEIEKELPFSPKEIEEYNVCGDQYGLGLWLIGKGISYNYFEEGCGVYTRSHLLLENLKRLNLFQYDVAKACHCMGENKKIKKKYIEFSSQEGDFDRANCVDFSVKNILKQLNETELNQVLNIFQVPTKAQGEKHSTLLLTQQFVNMGFLTLKEEKELYDLMLDFFAPKGALYVKPHPSDWQGLYKKWYKDATVFERFMPSELLPYALQGKFSKGVTVSSTSIFGLEPYMEDVVCLDSSFEDAYPQLIKYYVAGEIVKALNPVKTTYVGKFPRLFETLVGTTNGSFEVIVSSDCIVPQEDCVIYLNPENKNVLSELWMEQGENIVPIPVEIVDLNTGLETIEYLYCWCASKDIKDQISQLEVCKVLENSRKEIVVDTEYYKRKCLALEGMLKVTNERVKALKQQCEKHNS